MAYKNRTNRLLPARVPTKTGVIVKNNEIGPVELTISTGDKAADFVGSDQNVFRNVLQRANDLNPDFGVTIRIKEGIYSFDETLYLTSTSYPNLVSKHVRFLGEGHGTVMQKQVTKTPIWMFDDAFGSLNIENITFDYNEVEEIGGWTGGSTITDITTMMVVLDQSDVLIEGCKFDNIIASDLSQVAAHGALFFHAVCDRVKINNNVFVYVDTVDDFHCACIYERYGSAKHDWVVTNNRTVNESTGYIGFFIRCTTIYDSIFAHNDVECQIFWENQNTIQNVIISDNMIYAADTKADLTTTQAWYRNGTIHIADDNDTEGLHILNNTLKSGSTMGLFDMGGRLSHPNALGGGVYEYRRYYSRITIEGNIVEDCEKPAIIIPSAICNNNDTGSEPFPDSIQYVEDIKIINNTIKCQSFPIQIIYQNGLDDDTCNHKSINISNNILLPSSNNYSGIAFLFRNNGPVNLDGITINNNTIRLAGTGGSGVIFDFSPEADITGVGTYNIDYMAYNMLIDEGLVFLDTAFDGLFGRQITIVGGVGAGNYAINIESAYSPVYGTSFMFQPAVTDLTGITGYTVYTTCYTTNIRNLNITNNNILQENAGANGHGIYFNLQPVDDIINPGVSTITFENINVSENNIKNSGTNGHGIYFEYEDAEIDTVVTRFSVKNNTMEVPEKGIWVDYGGDQNLDGTQWNFDGNTIDAGDNGIEISADAANANTIARISISDNNVNVANKSAVLLNEGMTNFVLSGNILNASGGASEGMAFDDAAISEVTITGNQLISTNYGIDIANSSSAYVISGNSVLTGGGTPLRYNGGAFNFGVNEPANSLWNNLNRTS